MSKINELKAVIESLPEDDYAKLRQWFSEKDWRKWDKQIEKDSESGKLDFLIQEALDQQKKGKLRNL